MKTISCICVTFLGTIASLAEIYAASQILKGNVDDSFRWFWAGFLLGIIALVVSYLSIKSSKEDTSNQKFLEKKQSKHNGSNEYSCVIEIIIKLR